MKLGKRKHLLLTKEILKSLPPRYSEENIPIEDKILRVKFFNAFGPGYWYGSEYDPVEKVFFGFVTGLYEDEWGYFSLEELETLQKFGCPMIERDKFFTPCKFSDLKK